MTGPVLAFVLTMIVASGGLGWVVYSALRGAPGVVGWSPPPGSSRAPVYTFIIPWFFAGFAARSGDTGGGWLLVRLVMLLAAVSAMTFSWWRMRQNPLPPPRI